jgi:hypothetical protein
MVLYVAAPVAADTPDEIEANLARARRWVLWLAENTEHAISCPWLALVDSSTEQRTRSRGLRDCMLILERHDAIVLVGGRVSSGMNDERGHAYKRGLMVASLISFGAEPPNAERTPQAVAQLQEALTP